ncbi:uncharacterized protein HMPREF1541_05378 [Cyphellophora europaea CBS 101466]|uniref:Uncharacterized protein n=1 Tax=Cyphellophora europaea (strain CBS 101466) TaxID=1220924 RepID=W2RS64_CYPE1|nr:uncharacterized protein HMPREF1541_05378 [Cyphellophora europaea CBS 101466]ETN39155.1 hypothetical protein HMPREF1541_05378 [Cyphellophora europaea CBS 101466]
MLSPSPIPLLPLSHAASTAARLIHLLTLTLLALYLALLLTLALQATRTLIQQDISAHLGARATHPQQCRCRCCAAYLRRRPGAGAWLPVADSWPGVLLLYALKAGKVVAEVVVVRDVVVGAVAYRGAVLAVVMLGWRLWEIVLMGVFGGLVWVVGAALDSLAVSWAGVLVGGAVLQAWWLYKRWTSDGLRGAARGVWEEFLKGLLGGEGALDGGSESDDDDDDDDWEDCLTDDESTTYEPETRSSVDEPAHWGPDAPVLTTAEVATTFMHAMARRQREAQFLAAYDSNDEGYGDEVTDNEEAPDDPEDQQHHHFHPGAGSKTAADEATVLCGGLVRPPWEGVGGDEQSWWWWRRREVAVELMSAFG